MPLILLDIVNTVRECIPSSLVVTYAEEAVRAAFAGNACNGAFCGSRFLSVNIAAIALVPEDRRLSANRPGEPEGA